METLDLEVKGRDRSGKVSSRSLRRDGRAPAIIYGPKMGATRVSVDVREFEKQVGPGSHSHLLRLLCPDGSVGDKLVLVKDVQRHPVTRTLLHADLYEVDVHERIRVDIALNFVGKAAGVDVGGILQPIRRSVEVLCLPMQIPDEIEVDVTKLGIHDAIHISDLVAPEGVEIPFDTDITLVTVLPPVVEESRPGATEGGAEAAAAETSGEKKEESSAG
jgi:large subunit ribosomal protein L25